jgi:hypothetical protein
MTREEAARRYLQADMAAHAVPGERSYDPAREAHEETKRHLEKRHPGVRQHALVGTDKDFDEPLRKDEREHQAHLRHQSGLTNTQLAAQRKQLRDTDYGRHSPSEIYTAANPDRDQDAPRKPRGRRPGSRPRRRLPSVGTGGRSVSSTIAAAPAHEAGNILWEIVIAGIALSLLYLILTGTEQKKGVVTAILNGITGAFKRLKDPENNLFEAAPKTKKSSAPQVGPSKAAGSAEITRVFGPTLPNYSNLATTTPTAP